MAAFERQAELVRHRRNVALTSTALVIYYLGDADISNFFGNRINDTAVIIPAIWTALALFVWRYWIYARAFHKGERNQILNHLPGTLKRKVTETIWDKYQVEEDTIFDDRYRRRNDPAVLVDFFGYKGKLNVNKGKIVRIPLLKTGLELYVMREMIKRSLSGTYLELWMPYIFALFAVTCALYGDLIRFVIGNLIDA